jgi:ADP-ribose pyrophosphatase YjhB (NUDIX family)
MQKNLPSIAIPLRTAFWGPDKSTKVELYAGTPPLSEAPITTCSALVMNDEQEVLIVHPKRGWTLPGGHVEPHETALECIQRELAEEAGVTAKQFTIVGYWKKTQLFASAHNRHYPEISYQVFYRAELAHSSQWTPDEEISERMFVPQDSLKHMLHNYPDIAPLLSAEKL